MVRRYRIVDIHSVSTEPVCAAAGSLQPGPRLRDGGAAPGAAPARAGARYPGDRAHQHAALQAPGAASHRAAAQTRSRGDQHILNIVIIKLQASLSVQASLYKVGVPVWALQHPRLPPAPPELYRDRFSIGTLSACNTVDINTCLTASLVGILSTNVWQI